MKLLHATVLPHHTNNYKPNLIRHHVLLVMILCIFGMQLLVNYQSTGTIQVLGYATNISQGDLLALTNQQRGANGLSGLQSNSQLASAAQAKANNMITNNYWSHVAPDGTTPWYFINNAGYNYKRAGENLAYGFSASSGVVSGWMNSPAHAANILDSGFTQVGFGVANGAQFQGGENTVVVAMYGQPPTPQTQQQPPQQGTTEAQPNTPDPPSPATPVEESTPEGNETPQPKDEPEEKPEENSSNTDPIRSQYLLSQLDSASQIEVNKSGAVQAGSETITVFEALVSGQAAWYLYVSLGALVMIGFVYVLRHGTALYQMVVHGEHYVEGHPLLEASIIYGVIWLVMASAYGVII